MFYVDYGVVYGEKKVLISKSINQERDGDGGLTVIRLLAVAAVVFDP